jgi:hypothetical protein
VSRARASNGARRAKTTISSAFLRFTQTLAEISGTRERLHAAPRFDTPISDRYCCERRRLHTKLSGVTVIFLPL